MGWGSTPLLPAIIQHIRCRIPYLIALLISILVCFLMAISFNKLKDPKLGMLDKLTFGKLKDCRVCDVAQDHYEYLIWAEKNGFVKFQPETIAVCGCRAGSRHGPRSHHPARDIAQCGGSHHRAGVAGYCCGHSD